MERGRSNQPRLSDEGFEDSRPDELCVQGAAHRVCGIDKHLDLEESEVLEAKSHGVMLALPFELNESRIFLSGG